MLGTTAGIHADLYHTYDYKQIHVIGGLFLALVIGASILCLATLGSPKRVLSLVAAAGAVTEIATGAGLLYATHHTLFGFMDSKHAPHYNFSLVIEAIGFVVLALLAAISVRDLRPQSPAR
jgi:hypothetical protein